MPSKGVWACCPCCFLFVIRFSLYPMNEAKNINTEFNVCPFFSYAAICKVSPDSHFAFFLHFFSMGMILIPVSCTMS